MSKPIVLVTGGTGFVGTHVITLLLQQGYTVRAAVRQASKLRAIFPNAPASQLEVIEVPSLVSDYTEALKGISALIHSASPGYIAGETGEEIIEGAYHGTVNIVNTAIKGDVKKIIVTSTCAALFDPDFRAAFGTKPMTAQSWGSVPFSSIDPTANTKYIYQTSKTAAERELWAIAMSNPTVDFTTIVPPAIFGPFVPHFPNSKNRTALGTNDFVYTLLTGGPEGPNTYPPVHIGHMVDVRDVAKAHVQALSVSPVSGINKRLLISSGTFTWKATADLIRTARPELASRLPSESAQAVMQTNAPMDISLAAKVIGMSEDSYIRWEDTMLATIDAVVAWEKTVEV